MHTHACSHIQTCKHKYTRLPWQGGHGKHLRPGEKERDLKKREKNNWHQRNVLKTRHCKLFALHSRHCGAHVYINSLRMEAASFEITLYLLTAFWRTQRASSPARIPAEECREHRKDGEMGRYLAFSWGSQRGESSWAGLWLRFQSVDSDETEYRILGESWDFDNTFSSPLLQQKPNAFCFECLVATSPYLIPWVYNCSPACNCPKLPQAILPLPNCLFFFPPVTHSTNCLFMWWWSLWSYSVFIYSLKRFVITYNGFFIFFLIALTAFFFFAPHCPHLPSDTAPKPPRSDPLLRIDPGNGLLWTLWCAENSME